MLSARYMGSKLSLRLEHRPLSTATLFSELGFGVKSGDGKEYSSCHYDNVASMEVVQRTIWAIIAAIGFKTLVCADPEVLNVK